MTQIDVIDSFQAHLSHILCIDFEIEIVGAYWNFYGEVDWSMSGVGGNWAISECCL